MTMEGIEIYDDSTTLIEFDFVRSDLTQSLISKDQSISSLWFSTLL